MTLTVVVGSSGSGKTTFLNDVYKLMNRKCTYLRQNPVVRPYIPVSKIPDFDPTRLPFWELYQQNGTDTTVKVGGSLDGQFTAGLSEGQRNLVLFELICQRAKDCSDLLIALDEPFCGIHEEHIPYIIHRLSQLRRKHNIILVMNDHLDDVTPLVSNTISDVGNSIVSVNGKEDVDREKLIHALSMGDKYTSLKSMSTTMKLFLDSEVLSNRAMWKTFFFSSLFFSLFILALWDADEYNAPLVLVAAGLISYFCVIPYLLSLVEWRNAIQQETDALLQDSQGKIKMLKLILILSIIAIISSMEFLVLNAFIGNLSGFKFWVAIFCDTLSVVTLFICLGLYTHLSYQAVQIIGFLPFLLMVISGTLLSPGSGLPVLNELRYLYPRFYFWCMAGSIESTESCPRDDDNNMLYLILSTFIWPFVFALAIGVKHIRETMEKRKLRARRTSMVDRELLQLQTGLYSSASEVSKFRSGSETSSDDTQSCGEEQASLLGYIAEAHAGKDGDDEEVIIFTDSNSIQSNQVPESSEPLFQDPVPYLCTENTERSLQVDEILISRPEFHDKEIVRCHGTFNHEGREDIPVLSDANSSRGWSDSTGSSGDGSPACRPQEQKQQHVQMIGGDRYEDAIHCQGDASLERFLAYSSEDGSKGASSGFESSMFYDEESNTSSSLPSSGLSTDSSDIHHRYYRSASPTVDRVEV